MKYKILILVIIYSISFFSCRKKEIYPSDELIPLIEKNIDTNKSISAWGKFIIIDAKMYIENYETGEKRSYNHFNYNKSRSSLRFGGSIFKIESIIKDTTTYSFYKPINNSNYGKFVLNNDTSQHYAVYYMGLNKTIIEDPIHNQSLIGGSARPFIGKTLDFYQHTITIKIQETVANIGGYNCNYFTILTLKKIENW